MKILYHNPETIDCTADPHVVNYEDKIEMLKDVLKVLESPLVRAILSINVKGKGEENVLFLSDSYSDWSDNDKRKKAEGEYARKHKVEGLYFRDDAEKEIKEWYPTAKPLPIGLTGYRYLLNNIGDKINLEDIKDISIGVMWKFSMQHNCSDYITIDFNEMTIDFSNQDWYVGEDGYAEHCNALSSLLNVEIECSES